MCVSPSWWDCSLSSKLSLLGWSFRPTFREAPYGSHSFSVCSPPSTTVRSPSRASSLGVERTTERALYGPCGDRHLRHVSAIDPITNTAKRVTKD